MAFTTPTARAFLLKSCNEIPMTVSRKWDVFTEETILTIRDCMSHNAIIRVLGLSNTKMGIEQAEEAFAVDLFTGVNVGGRYFMGHFVANIQRAFSALKQFVAEERQITISVYYRRQETHPLPDLDEICAFTAAERPTTLDVVRAPIDIIQMDEKDVPVTHPQGEEVAFELNEAPEPLHTELYDPSGQKFIERISDNVFIYRGVPLRRWELGKTFSTLELAFTLSFYRELFRNYECQLAQAMHETIDALSRDPRGSVPQPAFSSVPSQLRRLFQRIHEVHADNCLDLIDKCDSESTALDMFDWPWRKPGCLN